MICQRAAPFINCAGQKLSTYFLLSHFPIISWVWQQLHHFIPVPDKPRIISLGGYAGSLWSPLSNLPSHSSRRGIPVLIWWHHVCTLIMTNHPLNHSRGCYAIVNWACLRKTTEDSVISFVRREKGEEIKCSPGYNLHTVVTFLLAQAVLLKWKSGFHCPLWNRRKRDQTQMFIGKLSLKVSYACIRKTLDEDLSVITFKGNGGLSISTLVV